MIVATRSDRAISTPGGHLLPDDASPPRPTPPGLTGFWTTPPGGLAIAVAVVVVAAVIGPLARRILAALHDQPALRRDVNQ
jgi:hypothetical protein